MLEISNFSNKAIKQVLAMKSFAICYLLFAICYLLFVVLGVNSTKGKESGLVKLKGAD